MENGKIKSRSEKFMENENALNNPPCPITPTLTSSSVHLFISSINHNVFIVLQCHLKDLLCRKVIYYYYHSLFHQIPGVAFFQFSRLLFKIFVWIFSWVIFLSSLNIPENLVEFCCVFFKLDHLTNSCSTVMVKWELSFRYFNKYQNV